MLWRRVIVPEALRPFPPGRAELRLGRWVFLMFFSISGLSPWHYATNLIFVLLLSSIHFGGIRVQIF
jgi:hypothetical protein